jgi:hypothetical protein
MLRVWKAWKINIKNLSEYQNLFFCNSLIVKFWIISYSVKALELNYFILTGSPIANNPNDMTLGTYLVTVDFFLTGSPLSFFLLLIN